jgi:menaquinone-dependent protoporphyrinogen oxidase
MIERILIAYASGCGATAEVAEAIGRVLRDEGATVDVRAVREVRGLGDYRAVVLGTAIRVGRPLPEAVEFIHRHREALRGLPVAVFSLGITMREDTPEHRQQTSEFLAPMLRHLPPPVALGLFAGQIDHSRLPPAWRWLARQDKSGQFGEGDWRNWQAIHAWAGTLLPALTTPVSLPQAD